MFSFRSMHKIGLAEHTQLADVTDKCAQQPLTAKAFERFGRGAAQLYVVGEVMDKMPRDLQGKRARVEVRDVLRRKFNKGDAVCVWAIGDDAAATIESGDILALWRADCGARADEAEDLAPFDRVRRKCEPPEISKFRKSRNRPRPRRF
jgi:hypothetical protein